MSKYAEILIMGTGHLPLDCACMVLEREKIPIRIFDCDETPSGFLKRRTASKGIPYFHLPKKELFLELEKVTVPTLLLSVLNPYILPEKVLNNSCVTAVNCHRALLPKHPGRNAEMWAIYEEDEQTGITWHQMTEKIDEGGIILQKSFQITSEMTAKDVLHQQVMLAAVGFQEICGGLLEGSLIARKQDAYNDQHMHYSWQRPNDSILDLSWPSHKISAFLRSMDYGILQIEKPPYLTLDGTTFFWNKYQLIYEKKFKEGVYITEDAIYIQKPDLLISLLHYYKKPNEGERKWNN